MAALVMLAASDRFPRLPVWMVVVILGREMAVTGLRSVASRRGAWSYLLTSLANIRPSSRCLPSTGLIIHYQYSFIDFHLMGMYFLWIALAVGVWSGLVYHVTVARHILGKDRTAPGKSVEPARHASMHSATLPQKDTYIRRHGSSA